MKLLVVELKPGFIPASLVDIPLAADQGYSGALSDYRFAVFRLGESLFQRQTAYLESSLHVANFTVIEIEPPYSLEKVRVAYTALTRPSDKRSAIFDLVSAERDRQDEKWGVQKHGHLYWLGILTEEVGEVAKAVIEYEDAAKLKQKLVQAAAVITAWLEGFNITAPQVGQLDTIFINYLRGDVSEGWACDYLEISRLEFRERLGEWLGSLLGESPVPVEGWKATKE